MTTLNIIQLVLLGILIAFGIYYVFSTFFSKEYQPLLWREFVKKGLIGSKLQKLERKYKDKDRFFNFWYQVSRLHKNKIPGAFAELGVYKGDTAEILHEMDNSREFHLFDTFEGFREADLENETGKAATYTRHNFADTSIERVKQRLSSDTFIFHKGNLSESIKSVPEKKYALVSMDVDLYNPTAEGLQYFYPRMSPGGVIIVHDYNPDWPGIMKAVDEFLEKNSIPSVPLTDRDNSIMIFK